MNMERLFNLKTLVKLRKKGILILPKMVREKAGLKEGDELIVSVEGNKIVLKKFEPLKVRVDPKKVEELLRDEFILEDEKFARILQNK